MFDLAKVSGFIFDCDGTLLDTLDAWKVAEEELFAAAGPLTPDQEDEIHSVPLEEAGRIFHERYGVGESGEAILKHIDDYLIPFYSEKAEALPGAIDFVRKVNRAGLPAVVLSSSPRRYLETGLRRVGILDCFSALITTDECGIAKSNPVIYERALDILETPKDTTWGVDDALYALRTMTKFGIPTIAVGNGRVGEKQTLLKEASTIYVDNLEELV